MNKTGLNPAPPISFSPDRSKAVQLLQFFVCAAVFHMWFMFCPDLFLISHSFGVSGGL